jgi:hypothetical protein
VRTHGVADAESAADAGDESATDEVESRTRSLPASPIAVLPCVSPHATRRRTVDAK